MELSPYYSFEPRWRPGLGQAQAPGELSQTANEIGSGLLSASAGVTQAAGPIAGAAVAAAGGIAELVGAVSRLFQGCGQTCVEATSIVNEAEPYLRQNNQIYFSNPNRTTGDQQSAIATAQQIIATIQQACGNPALGMAGQNCIQPRFGNGMNVGSNSCAFGLTTGNEYPPYCSVPYPVGVCWTWNLAYLDPIVNDIPPGGSGVATTAAGSVTAVPAATDYLPIVLIVAVLVGVMSLTGGKA